MLRSLLTKIVFSVSRRLRDCLLSTDSSVELDSWRKKFDKNLKDSTQIETLSNVTDFTTWFFNVLKHTIFH